MNGVAVLQAEEAASRLDRGKEVGRRKGKTWQTKGIGGVGLLGGDDPTTGPLVPSIPAGKGDRTYDSIPIHDRSPHIKVETTIRFLTRLGERCLQVGMAG